MLAARGAYHGAVPWCSPSLIGVTAEDRANILYYDYNDPESLRLEAELAGDDLAGILVSAFRHESAATRNCRRGPLRDRAAACDAKGAR